MGSLPQGIRWSLHDTQGRRGDTCYVEGDVFRIAVQSGVVSYDKNGARFYASCREREGLLS
jgi:hypothetical protein